MRNLIAIFLLLLLALAGCADKGFETSEAVKDFPIPVGAKPVKSKATNPYVIAHQKYLHSGDNEPGGISKDYLKAIEEKGWSELKEEQIGAARFFTKDGRIVSIEARPDSISLYELDYEK